MDDQRRCVGEVWQYIHVVNLNQASFMLNFASVTVPVMSRDVNVIQRQQGCMHFYRVCLHHAEMK